MLQMLQMLQIVTNVTDGYKWLQMITNCYKWCGNQQQIKGPYDCYQQVKLIIILTIKYTYTYIIITIEQKVNKLEDIVHVTRVKR